MFFPMSAKRIEFHVSLSEYSYFKTQTTTELTHSPALCLHFFLYMKFSTFSYLFRSTDIDQIPCHFRYLCDTAYTNGSKERRSTKSFWLCHYSSTGSWQTLRLRSPASVGSGLLTVIWRFLCQIFVVKVHHTRHHHVSSSFGSTMNS